MLKLVIAPILLTACLMLSSCASTVDSKVDLFQYEDSYVGDNSAVSNIAEQLPYHKEMKKVALSTRKEPYGITLTYRSIHKSSTDHTLQQTLVANATYFFTLVKNVTWIAFEFPNHNFNLNKINVQLSLGVNFSHITSEEQLQQLIQDKVETHQDIGSLFED